LEAESLREFHIRYQNSRLNNYPNTRMWPIQTLIKPSHIQMLHSSRLKTNPYSHIKPIQTLVWNIAEFQTKVLLEAESLREFHIRYQNSHLNNYPNTWMWPVQTLIKPSHIQMLHSSRLKTNPYSHMKPI
jgi:hypothetical protein